MNRSISILLLLLLPVLTCRGADYRTQTLETAHDLFRSATNSAMYVAAAKQYQYLVDEEGIRNGDLFYTLGNCWFMAGDAGRAILNYRRAERYMPGDPDLRYNLDAALTLRSDLIPEKEPHPLATRFLGWHLNTPAALRWWLFALFWILFWGSVLWTRRSSKKESRISMAITGVISLILLGSLLTETVMGMRSQPGVILADEVLARKGDGKMYALAFMDPLHSGTEFRQLEERGGWWHIRLADDRTCWIPDRAAELVVLASQ